MHVGSGWHHLQYSHNKAFQGLDSLRVKMLASNLPVHFVNYAAKLAHTRRIITIITIIINTHKDSVSGQACNPPDPHSLSLLFSLVT
jgi:hypothetical protein